MTWPTVTPRNGQNASAETLEPCLRAGFFFASHSIVRTILSLETSIVRSVGVLALDANARTPIVLTLEMPFMFSAFLILEDYLYGGSNVSKKVSNVSK